jgi:hypothetical protein
MLVLRSFYLEMYIRNSWGGKSSIIPPYCWNVPYILEHRYIFVEKFVLGLIRDCRRDQIDTGLFKSSGNQLPKSHLLLAVQHIVSLLLRLFRNSIGMFIIACAALR